MVSARTSVFEFCAPNHARTPHASNEYRLSGVFSASHDLIFPVPEKGLRNDWMRTTGNAKFVDRGMVIRKYGGLCNP